jgi:hypothetical protein
MKTSTEVTNPNILKLETELGHYPTEQEYLLKIVKPRLKQDVGITADVHMYDTGNADEMIRDFFDSSPDLTGYNLSVVRVANAGLIQALQVRKGARVQNHGFDENSSRPQLFIETDSLPVSRTAEDDAKPTEFQKASTGIKQLVLAAKMLHQAAVNEGLYD